MVKWFNLNQGFMMAILTFVYVITTIGILLSSKKSNKLLRESIARSTRPFVIIDFYPKDNLIYLRIKNTGVTPAIDISMTFNEKVEICNDTLNSIPFLKNIPILGSGIEIQLLMDDRALFMSKNESIEMITGKVSYKCLFSEKYEESIIINKHIFSEVVKIS